MPAEVSLLSAARAGQRSNEHLMQVYEACSAREEELLVARQGLNGDTLIKLRDAQERAALESFDQRTCERTVAALYKTGQAQVPTLLLAHSEAHGARASFRDDPRWQQNDGRSRVKSSARSTPRRCRFWRERTLPCRSSIWDLRCTKSSNSSSKAG